jgi:hypothetical protein
MTEPLADTLKTLQARLRAVHDEVHDLRQPGGDPGGLIIALADLGPGGESAISYALAALDDSLQSLDHLLFALGRAAGVNLPIGPTVKDRAASRRAAEHPEPKGESG